MHEEQLQLQEHQTKMNGITSDDTSQKLKMTSVKVKDQSDKNMVSASALDISITKFLESRSRELDAMRESASHVSSNARVMQQLPRHMRRRAASHNVKRLPRELRLAAEKEMQKSGGITTTSRRPSRRHRRRPHNLLQDYERRKRKHTWLETHIWHAKRFHMAEMWGYKVPLHPNDRGVRAAYRDSINKCLAFDLSYYCCIEISGPQELLLSGLSKLTSTEIGPSFGSQKYIRGTKEGRTVLYRENLYPFHALGEVKYLWKPQLESCDKESSRNLWIWTHPASYQLIFNEIKKVFQVSNDATSNLEEGLCIGAVVIRSLKDRLNRFRLIGPRSQEVLRRVFVPVKMDEDVPDESSTPPTWWQNWNNKDKESHSLCLRQASNWSLIESYQSPNDLLPNSVYGLVVRDPRVAGHPKKEPTNENASRPQQTERLESWVSASPIWDPDVQELVKATMMTTHEINDLKSKNLVPGSPLDLGARESRVPVLLVQTPGVSGMVASTGYASTVGPAGYGCGWDIILPSGWSLPFWIALNHSEAHAGGLQELRHISFERPELIFPDNYPDTSAGAEMNLSGYVKASEKYGKIPPAKRINYTKLKVKAPFHYPWKELIAGWKKTDETVGNATEGSVMSETASFYCLRSKSLLQSLQMLMNRIDGQNCRKRTAEKEVGKREAAFGALQKLSVEPCLVPVHLKLCGRGAPGQFSMICVPEEKDLLMYYESPGSPLQVHEDGIKKKKETSAGEDKEEMTKAKKRNHNRHSDFAPSAKKQKLEDCKNQHKIILGLNEKSQGNQPEHVSETSEKVTTAVVEALPNVGDVVQHCSRLTLGYVTSGSGVSFSKGCGFALGFVSLRGLLFLIENQRDHCEKIRSTNEGQNVRNKLKETVLEGMIVLIRPTRAEHYRFAKLNILQRDL